MQENKQYTGKRFSVLGDSISTLEGWNPAGYKLYYTGDRADDADVHTPADTWWEQVIQTLGGSLLVNDAWSGSRVTRLPGADSLFPSGCSRERTGNLHTPQEQPDVIMIYLGINDWGFGASPQLSGSPSPDWVQNCGSFDFAYDYMLCQLRGNYPDAEIWCCTLNESYVPRCPNFVFPQVYKGSHIESFNETIRRAGKANGCRVLDLYALHRPYASMEGTHPTRDGMRTLAENVLQCVEQLPEN